MANLAIFRSWRESLAHMNEMGAVKMLKRKIVRVVPQFLTVDSQNAQLAYLVDHKMHIYQSISPMSLPLECSSSYRKMHELKLILHLWGPLGTFLNVLAAIQAGLPSSL